MIIIIINSGITQRNYCETNIYRLSNDLMQNNKKYSFINHIIAIVIIIAIIHIIFIIVIIFIVHFIKNNYH